VLANRPRRCQTPGLRVGSERVTPARRESGVPPRRGRVPAVASTPTVVVEHREPPGQQRRQGAVTIRPAEPPHSRITGSPSLKGRTRGWCRRWRLRGPTSLLSGRPVGEDQHARAAGRAVDQPQRGPRVPVPDGGWGFESLAARQTRRSAVIKQEKLDGALLAMAVFPIPAPSLRSFPLRSLR
jgi:hypothetical protein